jgi:hypothetical protein
MDITASQIIQELQKKLKNKGVQEEKEKKE